MILGIRKSERVRSLLRSTPGLQPLLKPQRYASAFKAMDTDSDGEAVHYHW